KECTAADEERAGTPSDESCKGCFEITFAANGEGKGLQAERASGGLHVLQLGLGIRIVPVPEHRDHGGVGDQRVQQVQLLCPQLEGERRHARDVAAGAVQADYKAFLDRVETAAEHNGNGGCRQLGRSCCSSASSCRDHRDPALNQI